MSLVRFSVAPRKRGFMASFLVPMYQNLTRVLRRFALSIITEQFSYLCNSRFSVAPRKRGFTASFLVPMYQNLTRVLISLCSNDYCTCNSRFSVAPRKRGFTASFWVPMYQNLTRVLLRFSVASRKNGLAVVFSYYNIASISCSKSFGSAVGG